jgi:hypothetical protein
VKIRRPNFYFPIKNHQSKGRKGSSKLVDREAVEAIRMRIKAILSC